MEEKIYSMMKERNGRGLIDLLRSEPSLISFKDSRGLTLVMLATYFGMKDVADYVLAQRKPFDIYEAAVAGRVSEVEAFLHESPQLLNSFSADGFTPLGFASYFSQADVAAFLLERGAEVNIPSRNNFSVYPLHSAVAANAIGIVKLLLARGADPNVRQQNDVTPLHSAAHNGNAAIASLLLEFGAKAGAITIDGKTPFDMAREVNAAEVISLLQPGE